MRNVSPEEVKACMIIGHRRIPYRRSRDGHAVTFLLRYELALQQEIVIPPTDAELAEIEAELATIKPKPLSNRQLKSMTQRLMTSIAYAGLH